jgi:hypothetical protein
MIVVDHAGAPLRCDAVARSPGSWATICTPDTTEQQRKPEHSDRAVSHGREEAKARIHRVKSISLWRLSDDDVERRRGSQRESLAAV